ncbi:hypothetical protein [Aequorivita marina]|uniref:hypothetical protein n=1 Tax=Aequorivita marina TaxID=3073654 RepID=UPI0028751090|nr:hypothetical protein [Aequorivita sp. S2608]MDS1297977.1 hypothetical protein [Aequorivita sp. S2608]
MQKTIQIVLLLLSFNAIAQQDVAPMDFLIITAKVVNLEPTLMSIENLSPDNNFEIVFYGKNVTELLHPETEQLIHSATKLNLKMSVCKMSLDMLKINPKTLPKEIQVVDNAFLYALQLQKMGFKTLNI